jgi:hypothetical protein
MTADSDVPAWMVCEDIITRLKDELVLEAIDILHEEMKQGRVDINGYVSLLPDKSDEIQRDMYIINNLRMREHEILEQYRPYLDGSSENDPDRLKRAEDLKKFVLSVGAISTLMRFSEIAGLWADDTGKYSEIRDQRQIMIKTLGMAHERLEVLEFVLSSSKFMKSETLSPEEMEMLKGARSQVAGNA